MRTPISLPARAANCGQDCAARHLDAIRLSRPKQWSRHDRNHAPGIPHSDWP